MQRIKQEQHSQNYKWNVVGIVMVGTLMAAIDSSVVNVSIPAIMADFGSGVDDIEWVITGYMLAFAVLMPLTAWLKDRMGYKNVYLIALLLFTVGSLLCSISWNLPALILSRVIQALGGGALIPIGLAMITDAFPVKERGKAMGIYGMGALLGPASGPTLGGYLTNVFGWRSIFLVNLPIGIIVFVAAIELLKNDEPQTIIKRLFDIWGFLFLSLFLVSILLGLSKGEKTGWTSTFIISCAITAIISFIGFILVETNIDYQIMDLKLFKIPVFSSCLIITAARSVGLYGGMFLIPLFVQQEMGFSAMQSGLLLLPGSLAMAVFVPALYSLGDKFSSRFMSVCGLLITAYFMFEYSCVDINTSQWGLIQPTIIRSFGVVLILAPIMTAIMNSVPKDKISMASSMNSIIQQVGGTIGIAIFGTVLSNRSHYHLSVVGDLFGSGTPIFNSGVRNFAYHIHNLGFSYSQSALISKYLAVKNISLAASVLSFQDAFIIGGIIMLITIPVALLLPGKSKIFLASEEEKIHQEEIEEIGSLE